MLWFLPILITSGAALAEDFTPAARPASHMAAESCREQYAKLGLEAGVSVEPAGPRLLLRAESKTRRIEDIRELRIGTYNLKNLEYAEGRFVHRPAAPPGVVLPAGERFPQHLEQLGRTILSRDPDIMAVQEVMDFETLKRFADERLMGRYRVVLIEGNDRRGMDVAMLVKKDLPFDLEVQSHRDLRFRNMKHDGINDRLFSRDVPVMHIRKKGDGDKGPPLMSFMAAHLKSQRDVPGDPRSIYRRAAEAKMIATMAREFRAANPRTPIVLMGDFNSDIRAARELGTLWKAGFQDAFDLSRNQIPEAQRITHSTHPPTGPAIYSQLDGVLLADDEAAQLVKRMEILPYMDPYGAQLRRPTSSAERNRNPSDHFMVHGTIDFRRVLQRAGVVR